MTVASIQGPIQDLANQVYSRLRIPACSFNTTTAALAFLEFITKTSSPPCTKCLVVTLPCIDEEASARHTLLSILESSFNEIGFNLRIFSAILSRTGLLDRIIALPQVTLFVPTNQAFIPAAHLFEKGFGGSEKDALIVLLRVRVMVDRKILPSQTQFLSSLCAHGTIVGIVEFKDPSDESRIILSSLGIPLLSSGLGEIIDIGKSTRNAIVRRTMVRREGKLVVDVVDAVLFQFEMQLDSLHSKCT